VLALAALVLAGIMVVFNLRITSFLLDETIVKQSAVHYTHGPLYGLLHDANARATSRFYSLLLSPLFALFHGDFAVRLGRGLNGPLWVSSAIPVYLLARPLVARPWLAAGAALGSVALPWIALTTALFTENLAYPLLIWVVWAMARAYRAPAWWRDLVALGLIGALAGTRSQLAACFAGYVVLAVLRGWRDRSASAQQRGVWVRDWVRSFPFLTLAAAIGVLALLALLATGTLGDRLRGVLGPYANTTSDRRTLPSLSGQAGLVEVLAISIGVGFVPAVLALAWYPRAAAGRFGAEARAVGLAVVCALVALWVFTMWSQGGWLGPATEERYWFYVAPFLWIGAAAAVDGRQVRSRAILEAGLAIALVAFLLPLPRTFDVESSFFAPAEVATNWFLTKVIHRFTTVTGWGGLTPTDALGIGITAGALLTWAVWRRTGVRGGSRLLAVAGIVQVVITIVALAGIDGRIAGVPGRTTGIPQRELGFADRATGDRSIVWVDNQPHPADGLAEGIQRLALLYNDGISQRVIVPSLGLPLDALPMNNLPPLVGEPRRTGGIWPAFGARGPEFALQTTASPLFQLAGPTVATSAPLHLDVIRVVRPYRFTWLARGLDVAGGLAAGKRATLRTWGPHTVTLTLAATSTPAHVSGRLGASKGRVTADPSAAAHLTLCGDGTGTLRTDAPIVVVAARLTPARCR
jgi:hypothetical protein